jgi:hypothetical protein
MSGFNLRKCQIALQRYNDVYLSFVAHHILTRFATSKYLAEHFDPCCVNATSKISRSSSGGRYGRRSVSKDILCQELARKNKVTTQDACHEFREQRSKDIRFSDLPGVAEVGIRILLEKYSFAAQIMVDGALSEQDCELRISIDRARVVGSKIDGPGRNRY